MLQAERDFINLAEAHMAQLRLVEGEAVAIDDVFSGHAQSEQALLAQQIKIAAQNVRARAIAVAARRCEMLINKHFMTQRDGLSPDLSPDLNTELSTDKAALKIKTDLLLGLRTLDRLICLYATGLREIDPGFINEAEPLPLAVDILQGQSVAAQQLANLIYIAPIDDREALTRLVKIAAPHINMAQMDIDPSLKTEFKKGPKAEPKTDQALQNEAMDLTIEPSMDLENGQRPSDIIKPPAPEMAHTELAHHELAPCIDIGLESLMGAITDKALGVAYHSGRRISLSYDVGERLISVKMAERITHSLDLICAALIEHSFDPSPKGAMAQISITAADPEIGASPQTGAQAGTQKGARLDITANGHLLPADIFSQHADIAQLESPDIANHITVSLRPEALSVDKPVRDLLSSFDCDLVHELELESFIASPGHIKAGHIDGLHIQAGQDSLERRI